MENEETKTEEVKIDELEVWRQKAQENLDGWKRAQADFVNYKKDEMKRVSQLVGYQTEGVLEDVMSIADMFDAAFHAIPTDQKEKDKKWLEGIEYVRKQIDEVLKKNGVTRIEVKDSFDPTIHEALNQQEEESKIHEVRAGYMIGGRVLRPARVSFEKVNK